MNFNSNLKKIFSSAFLFSFFTPIYAQTKSYVPLVPDLPISGGQGGGELGTFLLEIFQWGTGVAVALAVLMIILGGVQYMTTDAFFKKEQGKERIKAAVIGLLLALSGWLILNQINPDILKNTNLALDPKNFSGGVDLPGGGNNTTAGSGVGSNVGNIGTSGGTPTGNIVPIPEGIVIKDGAGKNIDAVMVDKLSALNTALNNSGINWRVTEGYPPTRTHLSSCHTNGTCIDANFTGGSLSSANNIIQFINAAKSAGLRPVYEVASSAEKYSLISQGVPAENIINYGGITAPHFSVYNQ